MSTLAPAADPVSLGRRRRSERFLATLAPYDQIVLVAHVNPDPDSLASMLGLRALIERADPGKHIVLTRDGILARAENRAMVDLCGIPLVPVADAPKGPDTAVVMVDSQPRTGRRASEERVPTVVLDHHETGGQLEGVAFRDIRPNVGATTTIVTGYLLEQGVPVTPTLATALYYGIDSEASGYPREASPADDGALVWLFPRADKDLLAKIRNPRVPQSYFATVQHALANAFVYGELLLTWCGEVDQPDIIAEVADFFIRYDSVDWAVAVGIYDGHLRLSARVDKLHEHSGEVLRAAVDGLGTAGGHDRRAGGSIPLTDASPEAVHKLLKVIRRRLIEQLHVEEAGGRRLLEACATMVAP